VNILQDDKLKCNFKHLKLKGRTDVTRALSLVWDNWIYVDHEKLKGFQ